MAGSAQNPSGPVVGIDAGRASAETVLGAIDAVLASGLRGLQVQVELPPTDSRRELLEALCAADERVSLDGSRTAGAGVVLRMPARARPGPRALREVVDVLEGEGLARVVVPLPGPLPGRLVAEGPGSGKRRLKPAPLGLRTASSRREAPPPPQESLSAERAEHLRHRARGATMRARVDRSQNRLSRERLQVRHERARLRAAEARLGATGPGEWMRWRSRTAARRVAGLPSTAAAVGNQARNYARRAKRYAANRRRGTT